MKTIDRFMDKVAVADNGCWEWQAHKNDLGYGHLHIRPKTWKAHRWSYQYHIGEIPDGMFVCHKCDNPGCVNPDHLFIGTIQDNVDDMIAKGRAAPAMGERHGNNKLSEKDVVLIREFLKRQTTLGGASFLARWFRVGRNTISNIQYGKTWRHIT